MLPYKRAPHHVARPVRRRIGTVAAAALATATLVGGLAACSPSTPPENTSLGTLELATTWETTNFDPAQTLGAINDWAIGAVYEALFVRSDPYSVEPWLATDWQWDDSRTILTLTIREGVTFTDGASLDAEAVKANIDHIRAKGGLRAGSFAKITDVEATGDYEVTVTLSSPDGRLLYALAPLPIASPTALEDPEKLASQPVGSGPYVLNAEKSSPGVELVFDRNEAYWNPDAFPYGGLELKVLTDPTAQLNALISGQVQASPIDSSVAGQAESNGLELAEWRQQWVALVLGDRAGAVNPALADVRVRQAISMAIDRAQIVDVVDQGLAETGEQIFWEGYPAFHEELLGKYEFNPDKAKSLLAEAGYADGFELVIPSLSERATAKYEPIVQQALADIGITVTYDSMSADEYVAATRSGQYAATLAEDFPYNTIQNYLKSDSVFNGWKYDDPTVTKYLGIMDSGTDEESKQAFSDLGEYLIDQAWFAGIVHPLALIAHSPDVTVTPYEFGNQPLLQDIQPSNK